MHDKYTNGKLGLYDPGLHLFVDQRETRHVMNVVRRPGQLRKRPEPVLKPEHGWEFDRVQPASVMYDPLIKKFRCWYLTIGYDGPGAGMYNCYAESDDGITWTKPNLGLYEWCGIRETNICLTPAGYLPLDSLAMGMVYLDHDEPDANARYKCFAYMQNSKMFSDLSLWAIDHYIFTSPDGIRWTRALGHMNLNSASDRYFVVRDQKRGKWIGMVGLPTLDSGAVRTCGLRESDDLRNWTPPIQPFPISLEDGDGFRTDHHTLWPFLYGNQYLAGFELYEKPAFTTRVELVTSRDAQHWERPLRGGALLPTGPEGAFDGHWAITAAPIGLGDELRFYYQGGYRPPGAGLTPMRMGMATLRRDGFVGLCNMQAAPQPIGKVLTEPIEVIGNNLYLNLVTHSAGSCRVEVRDENCMHIKGFELDKCEPVTGDGVRMKVSWKEKDGLKELVGRRVMLWFEFSKTTLYAYKLGE